MEKIRVKIGCTGCSSITGAKVLEACIIFGHIFKRVFQVGQCPFSQEENVTSSDLKSMPQKSLLAAP